MENIIRIKPDKDGKLYIKLYGTRYEIIVEKEEPEKKGEKAAKLKTDKK